MQPQEQPADEAEQKVPALQSAQFSPLPYQDGRKKQHRRDGNSV